MSIKVNSNLRYFFLFLFFFSFFLKASDSLYPTGIVTAETLNVRARPGINYEVLCRLKKGNAVSIVSKHQDWLKILTPLDTPAWILTKSLNENNKIIKVTSVYCGPGILFSKIGLVAPADNIVIESSRGSDWLKIRPLLRFIAYVSAKYIKVKEEIIKDSQSFDTDKNISKVFSKKIVDKNNSKSNIIPAGQIQTTALVKDNIMENMESDEVLESTAKIIKASEVNKKYIKAKNNIPVFKTDKEVLTFEGVIVNLKTPIKGVATHALTVKMKDKYCPITYLRSPQYKLSEWVGKNVRISGERIWISGWKRPVIIVTQVWPVF